MVAPLENIRVLEVASWVAGPSCAALMRDMGADVIKVEPPGGEAYRHSAYRTAEFGPEAKTTFQFELDNRGKRSITADLRTPGGIDVVRRLAAGSDIFITNLILRRLQQYRLTVEDVLALNPRIVYTSLSGYGTDTPDAERAGFDYAAFWARAGIQSLIGEPGAPPPPGRGGQGDHTTALNLLASTLAALRLRDLTGEGQVVDVTLVGTGVWTVSTDLATVLRTHTQPPRRSRVHPANPLHNSFRCSDGKWLMLVMAQPDRYWPQFCKALGHPEWIDDPRYETLERRGENAVELTEAMEAIFAAEDHAAWARKLDEADVIWAPVAELPDVIVDETIRALGSFSTVEHPAVGSYETMSAPFRIRGADIAVRGRAPFPGEHTHDILIDRGFSAEEIASLAEQGAFG